MLISYSQSYARLLCATFQKQNVLHFPSAMKMMRDLFVSLWTKNMRWINYDGFSREWKYHFLRMVKRYSLLSVESVQYGKFLSGKTYVSRTWCMCARSRATVKFMNAKCDNKEDDDDDDDEEEECNGVWCGKWIYDYDFLFLKTDLYPERIRRRIKPKGW